MSDNPVRGVEREINLDRSTYFSDKYFSLPQLASFAHQLNQIWGMRPKSAVEIGIGNGFVSTFLKRAGLEVITVDINPSLRPDICAPLNEVREHLSESIDLVICCEVLEHMPLSELDQNLQYLREIGDRLFLTLPSSRPIIGLGALFRTPWAIHELDLHVSAPYKRALDDREHFWEVGISSNCSRKSIHKRLRRYYGGVQSGRFTLNPYHCYFKCN